MEVGDDSVLSVVCRQLAEVALLLGAALHELVDEGDDELERHSAVLEDTFDDG